MAGNMINTLVKQKLLHDDPIVPIQRLINLRLSFQKKFGPTISTKFSNEQFQRKFPRNFSIKFYILLINVGYVARDKNTR